MPRYYRFHKPYDVLSQFTKEEEYHRTLADYLAVASSVYPVGRLDRDSEGLLLLTDDRSITAKLMDPKEKMKKTYWAQVDGAIDEHALAELRSGVQIKLPSKKMYKTLPAEVMLLDSADISAISDRVPPVRYRKNIPTSWIEIVITEGKNRQVRKMCAKVGFPVLRLIRQSIGQISLAGLAVGEYEEVPKFI